MRTTRAAILGKSNPAVSRELSLFNVEDCRLNKATKLPALFFRNGRPQVLDFRQLLSHEDDQCNIRNATDPGIANQLRIQSEEAFWLLGITARSRLPIDQTL